MSDYISVLARKEATRDAELLSPPLDEDSAQGVLKRQAHHTIPYHTTPYTT
jgi:hypothetical protein